MHFSKRGSSLARHIDRFLGIPVVFVLSIFHRKASAVPSEIQRVGILISAAIGDTVVFSPFLSAIKEKHPHSKITLFMGPSNVGMVPLLRGVDKVIKIDPHRPRDTFRKIRQAGKFDVWIDTGQWARLNALFSYAADATYRVGFKTPGQFRHSLYDATVEHSSKLHEWENFRRLVRSCFDVVAEYPKFDVEKRPISNQVVVHPYAGGAKAHLKEWPDRRWKHLIDEFTKKGTKVVISASPSDRSRATQLKSLCENNSAVTVASDESLEALAKTLADSQWVVAVNTGVMHLAAALGVKTIGIHGPTSSLRWGPLGENTVAVSSRLGCSPCLQLGFDYGCPRNHCMLEISAERVLNAMESSLISVSVAKPSEQRQKKNLDVQVMRPVTNIE